MRPFLAGMEWMRWIAATAGEGSLVGMSDEETLAFLTRNSPKPPDGGTLLWAVCALAAAWAILWLYNRRKGTPLRGPAALAAAPALASFLWAAWFAVSVLCAHLWEPPLSSAREGSLISSGDPFDRTLAVVRQPTEPRQGILLVNCTTPRQAEWVKYCLYPRRIIIEDFSRSLIPDPLALRDADSGTKPYLRSLGAHWILDCAAAAGEGGAGAALLEVSPSLK